MRERERRRFAPGFASAVFKPTALAVILRLSPQIRRRPLAFLSVSAEASSPAAVVVIFFTIKGKLNLINIKGSSRSLAPFIRRVQQTLRRRCVFRVESSSTQPFSQQAPAAIVHCRRAAFVAGTLFSDLRQRRRRRRPPVCLRETSSVAEMHTLAG
jgi:hypothetical protein